MRKPRTIVSIDGEFTGPDPSAHSLISLGAVAFSLDGDEIGRIRINMREQSGSVRDAETMKWWGQYTTAWEAATCDQMSPQEGMQAFATWLQTFADRGSVRHIGWESSRDTAYLDHYFKAYRRRKMPFTGLHDFKTAAMVLFDEEIPHSRGVSLLDFLRIRLGVRDTQPPSHIADDDAYRQGTLYFALTEYARQLQEKKI